MLLSLISAAARRVVPLRARRSVSTAVQRATRWPPIGNVDLGDLRRITPISADWGFDRGTPIDRYLIRRFLAENADAIRGRTLEIDTDDYTREFGGDRVVQRDVLHQSEYLPGVTLVGDLVQGDGLPTEAFDCVVVTQTLQLIRDPAAAIRTIHRILTPGGVLLCTFPGISRFTGDQEGRWGYHWGFTSLSAKWLFDEHFGMGQAEVRTYGNVLTATAFLFGLAAEELAVAELEHNDADVQLLIAVRATKASGG